MDSLSRVHSLSCDLINYASIWKFNPDAELIWWVNHTTIQLGGRNASKVSSRVSIFNVPQEGSYQQQGPCSNSRSWMITNCKYVHSCTQITQICAPNLRKYVRSMYSNFSDMCTHFTQICALNLRKYVHLIYSNMCTQFTQIRSLNSLNYVHLIYSNKCTQFTQISANNLLKYMHSIYSNMCT